MTDNKDEMNSVLLDADRLAALRSTGLLDSPEDDIFDSLTRLVCRNLSAPMSLITLVDNDRQFFKSQSGMAILDRQAPLSHSICKFVVREKSMVIIEDVRTHPFTLDKLALPSMGVLSYIGAPLLSDGQVIGSLCAVDKVARRWTEDQVLALEDLASVTMLQITAHKIGSKL